MDADEVLIKIAMTRQKIDSEDKYQIVIDWDAIREKIKNLSDAESQLMKRCFFQMVHGNSFFKEMLGDPKLANYLSAFEEGWIMHELFVKGK